MARALNAYAEKLEYETRPLANLGTVTARLHGVQDPDTGWINEYEVINRKRELNKLFRVNTAKFYVKQWDAGKVPAWVDQMTDIDRMKLAAL